jgi:ketosteroid isomerase-like protein
METTADREQSIDTLRATYAAFNRGDIEPAVQGLDSRVEWTEPLEFPGGGTCYGVAGVKAYLTQSRNAWADVRSEPERFIPVGDRIVVFVHARVRPEGSDAWQEVRLADVYTFRNGTVVHMEAFAHREDALRAVGIEEPSAM